MPAAGQRVRAVDFPTAVTDTQNTSGTTTTSVSYTETLTTGTACGVVFTAPTSGRVLVLNTADLNNSGTGFTRMSFVVRTGSSIGSGTVFLAAADSTCVLHVGAGEERNTVAEFVSGLTAGNSYNVRQAFKVTAATTGTFQGKTLTVIPLP